MRVQKTCCVAVAVGREAGRQTGSKPQQVRVLRRRSSKYSHVDIDSKFSLWKKMYSSNGTHKEEWKQYCCVRYSVCILEVQRSSRYESMIIIIITAAWSKGKWSELILLAMKRSWLPLLICGFSTASVRKQ
ncbi:hypothetical protein Tco_1225014 [Tanacetum coccineum]